MKKLLTLVITVAALCSCKKESPVETVNTDLNPVAVRIYINDSTESSQFIRVR